MRRGFLCAGCWTLDRIKFVDQWPDEESLALITDVDKQGGGSAHNVGIDLRKLDTTMPVATIGLLGQDADGDYLHNTATAHGIDATQLHRTVAVSTSYTDVVSVKHSGKRTFFHHAGANNHLSPDQFDFSTTTCRYLHLGLLGVHECLDSAWQGEANGWVSILKKAKRAGLKTNVELVSIDPMRNREICLPCLPYLDTLIVNDHEIGGLADCQTIIDGTASKERCLHAARAVIERGSMELVVVHFPQGAVCVHRDGRVFERQAVKVDPSVISSTVGAGDAFAAGMLYGLHEEFSIEASLELAHAVAAMSLRSRTTVGSIEPWQSCLAAARARQDILW